MTREDAISRQAVLDIIEDDKQDGCYSCFEDAEEFEQKVREIPSVTPKTKIGKWIVHPKGMYAHLVCNKCISRAPYDCRTNYCPNCGAKMAESEE